MYTLSAPVRIIFSALLLFSFSCGCKREPEDNNPPPGPPIHIGLIKRVEIYGVSGTSLSMRQYVNFNYDSLNRLSDIEQAMPPMSTTSQYGKRIFKLYFAAASSTVPYLVEQTDSINNTSLNKYEFFADYKYYMKYDAQNRKRLDSMIYTSNTGSTSPAQKVPYFYSSYGSNSFFLQGATFRISYDNNGNFISQDIEGASTGPTGVRDYIKIDSSYNQISPMYLGNITNCLNYVFKYDDFLFRNGRGFSSLRYEFHLNANKIPKSVTIVSRNMIDLKDYPEKHFFTYNTDASNRVAAINFDSKFYNPDGSLVQTVQSKIKFTYYE